jgi:hypothetical protein
MVGRHGLPQDRIPQLPNAKLCNEIEIFDAIGVPARLELVKIKVANPVDGAFDPSPEFRQAFSPRSSQSAGFYFAVTHPTLLLQQK